MFHIPYSLFDFPYSIFHVSYSIFHIPYSACIAGCCFLLTSLYSSNPSSLRAALLASLSWIALNRSAPLSTFHHHLLPCHHHGSYTLWQAHFCWKKTLLKKIEGLIHCPSLCKLHSRTTALHFLMALSSSHKGPLVTLDHFCWWTVKTVQKILNATRTSSELHLVLPSGVWQRSGTFLWDDILLRFLCSKHVYLLYHPNTTPLETDFRCVSLQTGSSRNDRWSICTRVYRCALVYICETQGFFFMCEYACMVLCKTVYLYAYMYACMHGSMMYVRLYVSMYK